MIVKGNTGGSFDTCPEFTGQAVCVDVTPLKKTQTAYGEKDTFKLVFEVAEHRKDGSPYCVWSFPFTPGLGQKANLRKFLKTWLGRDLTEQELEAGFDLEQLIGRPAFIVVGNEKKEGETYANIVACTPDKSATPLKASGKFIRAKDREAKAGAGASYSRAEQHGEAAEGVPCPHCGVRAPLEFEQLVWDTNDTTCPGRRWDFVELTKTIRYRFPCCQRESTDSPPVRQALAEGGVWIAHHPKAPPHLRSYTWNALLPTWVPWAAIVEEFLLAKAQLENGNFEPFKTFWNETLGRSWEDRLKYVQDDDFITDRKVAYDPAEKWPEEARRFCTIDVQGKGGRHYCWCVRAWAAGGASRLVAFGQAWSMEELRSVVESHRVPRENVAIDSGHFTSEVYNAIMESGVLPSGDYAWKAMKGDKGGGYVIDGVRHYFTWSFVDPYLGKGPAGTRPIRQLLFSKTAMLDRMELFMRGLGPVWSLPSEALGLSEYVLQITAYERREHEDAKGVVSYEWFQKRPDDHWGSCERMQLVCAMATGLIDQQPINPAAPVT